LVKKAGSQFEEIKKSPSSTRAILTWTERWAIVLSSSRKEIRTGVVLLGVGLMPRTLREQST
jgi:hypothetical protein